MNTSNTNNRVLIIDDNPAIHEDFTKILRPDVSPTAVRLDRLLQSAFGKPPSGPMQDTFELSFAVQGSGGVDIAAAALAAQRPFAVAFVDIRMPPGWDGVETIARLWEADPNI